MKVLWEGIRDKAGIFLTSMNQYVNANIRMGNRCQNCLKFICDRHNKICCGKPCKTCGFILLYLLGFTILILLIFVCFMGSLYQTQEDSINKHLLFDGNAPGLTALPRHPLSYFDHPLVLYSLTGNDIPPEVYEHQISQFIEDQEMICKKIRIQPDGYCVFVKQDLGPCSKKGYGFPERNPCLILKLNVLRQWKPIEYRAQSEMANLPAQLKKVVQLFRPVIWIHCEGKGGYDKDHMGKLKYYPEMAFHEYYFPASEHVDVASPAVAVQVINATVGVIICMICRLFAANNLESEFSSIKIYILLVD